MSEMVKELIEAWHDATNAVCQVMQESNMCACKDGECLAATVHPSQQEVEYWAERAATAKAEALA